eukprot:TRINITY_DN75329_c0_g1_i1.p1 TRINITY_DN75329_c0_g1~~TRINITY_DN75329_c0_g1_i1.p1  ORF type:complete len:575 (-),score=84.43 TRINITY_DN75329_c0_g1_i1:213-1937(-)
MPGQRKPEPCERTPLIERSDDSGTAKEVMTGGVVDSTMKAIGVLPYSKADFDPGAWNGPVGWINKLQAQLPCPLLGSICITHFLLKGIAAGGGDEGLIGKPIEFLLGSQHVSADRLQGVVMLGAFTPWVLKPLIGAFSDTVPIFGYRRNGLMAIVTALACGAVLCLGTGVVSSTHGIICCLFFASLQVACCTLLVDAKKSEVTKSYSSLGPDLVTYSEVGMNCGIIGSALLVGPLLAFGGPRVPYFVALPFVALPLLIVVGNWMKEQQLPLNERRASVAVLKKNPALFSLGLTLMPMLTALGLGSMLGIRHHYLAIIAGVASVTVIGGYMLFIRPEISGPVVLLFMLRCLTLQVNGALFYFLTDSPVAFPGGPNFSPLFYASVITVVAIAGRTVGVMTARQLFGQWHYTRVLQTTVPMVAISQLCLVPMLLRWNLRHDVPDGVWILGWTFCDMVVRGWRHFPFTVMFLQATPKGIEASSLALNTGVVNMGATLGSFFGASALNIFEVWPAGHPSESSVFDGLWKAQCASAVLPLLILPLMPLLLPKRTQDESLILDHHESATHGALFWRVFSSM